MAVITDVLELDARETPQELIELLYLPASGQVGLRVTDRSTDAVWYSFVPADEAHSAFAHPYAYLR
jgi:hypothetical protein